MPIEFAKQNLLTSANCLGAEILLKLLKTYTNVNDVKQTITVGVVGKIKNLINFLITQKFLIESFSKKKNKVSQTLEKVVS